MMTDPCPCGEDVVAGCLSRSIKSCGNTRKDRPWSDSDDKALILYGYLLSVGLADTGGYEFVAKHDLRRSVGEGAARILWLQEHRPLLVKEIMAREDYEPDVQEC